MEGVSVASFGIRMLPQLAGDGDKAIAQQQNASDQACTRTGCLAGR